MQGALRDPRLCLGLPRTEAPPARTHSSEAVPGVAEAGVPGPVLAGGPQRMRGLIGAEALERRGQRVTSPVLSKFSSRAGVVQEARRGREAQGAAHQPPRTLPFSPPPRRAPGGRRGQGGRSGAAVGARGHGVAPGPGFPAPLPPGLAPAARAPPATLVAVATAGASRRARARPPARPPAGGFGSGGSSSSSRARCDPAPQPARRLRPGPGPPARPPIRPRRPPGRWPLWSCWPQPSAQPARWTTTAPPRRATRATRRQDTCPAGEDERPSGPPRVAPARLWPQLWLSAADADPRGLCRVGSAAPHSHARSPRCGHPPGVGGASGPGPPTPLPLSTAASHALSKAPPGTLVWLGVPSLLREAPGREDRSQNGAGAV